MTQREIALQEFIIKIEFDKVLGILSKFHFSHIGVLWLNNQKLQFQKAKLDEEFDRVFEFKSIIQQHLEFPFFGLFQIDEIIHKCEIENYFIESSDFLKIKKVIENVEKIKLFFNEKNNNYDLKSLTIFSSSLYYDQEVYRILDKIIDDKGEVKDNASGLLQEIRAQKNTIFKEIDKVFKSQINQYRNLDFLAETGESIRNGRRVLAVLAEKKRQVKGIIHDESESGKIIYIEPEAVIALHNDALNIDREEKRELIRILKELTQKIAKYKNLLIQYQNFLAHFDHIQAKAQWAIKMECSRHTIAISPYVKIVNGYHPLLKYKNDVEHKKTVPFSLEITKELRMLLISGPNAGGKSITLKSIGLLAMMNQYGIPIPVESTSKLTIFESFFGDFGDNQSLEDELSTYSSKLKNWKEIIEKSNTKSLILFDEMGTGTDPSFGSAMAQVVLDKCIENESFTIVTTHFGSLKKFANENRFIKNASMLFDEQKLEPLYILSIGRPGSSYTFHIAKKMGLHEPLIEKAKKLVQTDQVKYDHLLLKLEIKEKDLIKKQKDLEQAEKDLKSQIKNWNKVNNELELLRNKIKFERMLFQNEKEIEKEKEVRAFAEELKKQQKEEEIKEERRIIQEKIAENTEQIKEAYKQIHNVPLNQNFQIGSWVRYIQTQAMGKIERIERKKAVIIFDNIKSTIPLSDLILVPDDEIKKQYTPRKVTIEKVQLSDELDLRGMFVAEAIPELEKYINDALVQNKFQSKIIHGRGNLKREVLKTINSIKSISKIAHAEPEQGGDGITYIYF